MTEKRGATPQSCFEFMMPTLAKISQACRDAPMPPEQQAGLSLLVAMHFFGVAMADGERAIPTGRPQSAQARELLEHIVDSIARAERPTVISSHGQSV